MLHWKDLIAVVVREDWVPAVLALWAGQLLSVQAAVHAADVPVLVFFALASCGLRRRGASPPAGVLLASLPASTCFTALCRPRGHLRPFGGSNPGCGSLGNVAKFQSKVNTRLSAAKLTVRDVLVLQLVFFFLDFNRPSCPGICKV